MMHCPVKTTSPIENPRECEREIRDLHPPSWQGSADGIADKEVSEEVRPREEVEEYPSEALEEEGHNSA